MAQSKEGGEQHSTAEDQMLIERDGKYELVNASEVQVTDPQPEERGVGSMVASGEHSEKDQQKREKLEDHPPQNESREPTGKQTVPLTGQDISDHTNDSGANAPPIKQRSDDIQHPGNVLSATSTYTLGRERTVNITVGRTKSAPGLRRREDEIKRRNETAFSAWLAAKDEELAKRRQAEREETKRKEDMLSQKQGLNEAAYKAWLERKTSELELRRKTASRPSTSIPKSDEARKQAAFEAWINSKKEQHRKEVEEERERRAQEEERAKNTDPTLVDQAYKKLVILNTYYVHRKCQLFLSHTVGCIVRACKPRLRHRRRSNIGKHFLVNLRGSTNHYKGINTTNIIMP